MPLSHRLRAIRDAVGIAIGEQVDTDVISDSRAALYKDIRQAGVEGKRIRLWCTKAHVGIEGNIRADEAAGAALESEISVSGLEAESVARRPRREKVISERQRRWDAGTTGRLLHAIVGTVNIRIENISRDAVHLLTGHSRVAAYYNRF